jgi:hypothetical protein
LELITSIPPLRHSTDNDLETYLKQCVESWRKHGFHILSLNREHEAEQARRTFGLNPILFRDPEQSLYPGEFGPAFREIGKHLQDDRPVCIINADAYLLDDLDVTKIEDLCQNSFLFAHRVEVPTLSGPFHSIYRKGVDFVAFRPDRIRPILQNKNFTSFKLGLASWDYVLPIAASFFVPVWRILEPFILHRMHKSSLTSEIYDVMRVRAFDVLRQLALEQSASSAAASDFNLRIKDLNIDSKADREFFSQLCLDWLAGRVGPIREIALPFVDNEHVGKMLCDTLAQLTVTRELLEKQNKHVVKCEARLDKAQRAAARLKSDIAAPNGNSRHRKPRKDGFCRVGRAELSERLAEQWLALWYGWDLEVFRGYKPITPHHSGAYHIRNPRRVLLQIRPKIEALHLTDWFRFGNSIRQLLNAFHMAETLGVHTIGFSRPHPFFAGQSAGEIDLDWNARELDYSGPCLVGNFFHLNAFRRGLTASRTARLSSELIRPLLTEEIRKPDPRVREDDLVLHFRSGDAFAGPTFPRNHGQPPVSYYLSAIEREQPTRVWLVFENRSNPCINAVEAVLRSRGIEVLVQSGSLEDDLRVLFNAQTLVAGRGSFVYMMAHLSDRLRRLYIFEGARRTESLRKLGVEVFIGKDIEGGYKTALLDGNWTGSPMQYELMLSYPAEKIGISQVTSS